MRMALIKRWHQGTTFPMFQWYWLLIYFGATNFLTQMCQKQFLPLWYNLPLICWVLAVNEKHTCEKHTLKWNMKICIDAAWVIKVHEQTYLYCNRKIRRLTLLIKVFPTKNNFNFYLSFNFSLIAISCPIGLCTWNIISIFEFYALFCMLSIAKPSQLLSVDLSVWNLPSIVVMIKC